MGADPRAQETPSSFTSHLADRQALFAALAEAAAPGQPARLLVLARVDVLSIPAPTKALLETAGRALARLLGPGVNVYRARRGEFWIILDGSLELRRELLDSIAPTVASETDIAGLRTVLAVVAVPEEAQSAEAAVALAHQRLRAAPETPDEGRMRATVKPADEGAPSAPRAAGHRGWLPGRRGRRVP